MARRRRMHTPTPRRKRVWADKVISDLVFAEDALRSDNLLSDYVASGGSTQGITVVRTIVQLQWTITALHTAGDFLTVGLIKGTTATADVADPVAEPYADWAYITRRSAGRDHGLTTASAANYFDLDVRSARKVDEIGETWWMIYRGSAPTTVAATFDVRARVRTLLLLP